MLKKGLYSLLILCLFISLGIHPVSSNTVKEIVSKEQRDLLIRELQKKEEKIKTFTATVIQKKKLRLLSKTVESRGQIFLKRPMMFKWITSSPEKTVAVLNNHVFTVYHPDKKEAQIYDINKDFIAHKTMAFFEAFMLGDIKKVEEDFDLRIFYDNNKGLLVFMLSPKNSIARRYVSSIEIKYIRHSGIPVEMIMKTPKGDTTITTLKEQRVNIPLQDSLFKLKLSSDVWITNRIEDEEENPKGCCF